MISGVFSPTVTVMSDDGIDIPATRHHIQRLVDSGVHGLCPGGSGGEFVGLTYAERQQVIALGIQASAKRIPVYAAAGASYFMTIIPELPDPDVIGMVLEDVLPKVRAANLPP